MAEKNSDPRLLETEPIPKLLLQYAVPAIITTLSTSLYNLVDRIFIGQGAGAMAISGLALSLPIMNFLQAFGTLVGVGASTRISIVLGMHDRKWAENILGNALILTFAFFILLCASGLLFLEPLLRAFGGSENTIPYAASYMKIIIPTSILSNLSYSFCNIIRASGAPRKSMTIT
ncbi:MAG: MATE family efflux transporter, partial [Bacteroidales bacterium]|nr:MATE family efflux transporter [Bacteroidales bacterium]